MVHGAYSNKIDEVLRVVTSLCLGIIRRLRRDCGVLTTEEHFYQN